MHKLVYFDMSLHTRPSHAEWQGKIVSLSGREGYLSTDDIGYGTGAGFKGYNCRHDWFPFFEGISERAYSDKELEQRKNETVTYEGKEMSRYDAEQKQRAMERQAGCREQSKPALKRPFSRIFGISDLNGDSHPASSIPKIQ